MLDATQFIIPLQSLIDNPFKKRFLLAVSGGVDSCVMAYLFHQQG
jgi:tRNA(Ile)-lysidine synthase TilS/MesJ